MKFMNPYWSVQTKIELISKWIIIHSIIYYELDTNIVEDRMFDMNCKQLVEMVKDNPQSFKDSKWYYVMKGFDGSSGFDLYKKLNKSHREELLQQAGYLVYTFGKEKQNGI